MVRTASFLPLLAIAAVAWGGTSALAQDENQGGWKAIEEGHFEAAEFLFRVALEKDANHAEAHAGLGVAFARQGRYPRALPELRKGRELGASHEHIDLEEGRACYFMREFGQAIDLLERYRATRPTVWQTDEILGLCYFYTKQFEKALEALGRAYRSNTEHRALFAFHMGLSLAALGRGQEAVSKFQETTHLAPDSIYAREAQRLLKPQSVENLFRPRLPEKPWFVRAGIEGRYDTNPLSLGEIVGPTTLQRDEDFIFGANVGGGVWFELFEDTEFRFELSYVADFHDEFPVLDLDVPSVSMSLRHWLSDTVSLGFGTNGALWWIGGDRQLDTFGGSFFASLAEAPWTQTILSFGIAFNEYDLAGISTFNDPDSRSYSASLRQDLLLPETKLLLGLSYSYSRNDADGDDYDANYHSVALSASHPLFWEIQGTLTGTYTRGEYDDPNSRANPAFSAMREDDIVRGTVQLERKFGDSITVTVLASWGNHDSSVAFYDFSRDIYSLGVTVRF